MFYLEDVIDLNKDKKKAILEILRARGFFIDKKDGRYYLSDNAAVEDLYYLAELLEKYKLGKVFDVRENREVAWKRGDKDSEIEKYRALRRLKFEILIDENATVEDAIRAFHDKTWIGEDVLNTDMEWWQFAKASFGKKVPVSRLEPYVAYYVKALSACGIDTVSSCDGNHEDGGSIYVQSRYPSCLLHEYIWEVTLAGFFGKLPFIEEGICFKAEKSKQEVYQLVYKMADRLYGMRYLIRDTKKRAGQGFDKKFCESHSKEELEELYRKRYKEECGGQSLVDGPRVEDIIERRKPRLKKQEPVIRAIEERHSVRNYLDKKIEQAKIAKLQGFIKACNEEGNLHLQFCEDAGNTYNKLLNKAMGLGSAPSVIACVGPDDESLEERIGYYGEKIVIFAQRMGLNTCWAGTFNKKNIPANVEDGERLVISIAIGYGADQGKPHKSKDWEQVATGKNIERFWFVCSVEVALLAPTAMNQQKFEIRLNEDGTVSFIDKGGVFSKVDLGIVKYHFEVGAKYFKR